MSRRKGREIIMNRSIGLTINGAVREFDLAPETPLLYVLRNDCGLNGPKLGCGLGECGACAVLVDEKPIRACTTRLRAVEGRKITTIEGLSQQGALHPVQQAFVAMQAAQCGYCLNGMIIAMVGLFNRKPAAGEADIRAALRRHLCRCGTHMEILAAARMARDAMAAAALATSSAPAEKGLLAE
jgi:nicotinate dehydrogenase subunit A